jgi:hypothetical protein
LKDDEEENITYPKTIDEFAEVVSKFADLQLFYELSPSDV